MLIGYARTSTDEQDYSLEDQIQELKKQGCEKIYSEQVSAGSNERPEFEKMIEFAREGDVIIILKLDRGFRDTRQALEVAEYLMEEKIGLRLMDLGGVDITSPAGKLIYTNMAAFAEFERARMKERQMIGIQKAKAEGKYKGRRKSIDEQQVRQMKEEGIRPSDIAKELNIARSSVYRMLS